MPVFETRLDITLTVDTERVLDVLDVGWGNVGYWIDEEYPDGAPTSDLTPKQVREGLGLMATANPYQFGKILTGDYDATTGDVLVQFCLLGAEVYG